MPHLEQGRCQQPLCQIVGPGLGVIRAGIKFQLYHCFVTTLMLLNPSRLHFSSIKGSDNGSYTLCYGSEEWICVKYLSQCLAHSKKWKVVSCCYYFSNKCWFHCSKGVLDGHDPQEAVLDTCSEGVTCLIDVSLLSLELEVNVVGGCGCNNNAGNECCATVTESGVFH